MRVVLDTNVLVSAFVFGGVPRQIFLLAGTGDYEVITSVALVDELHGVLLEKFRVAPPRAMAYRREVEASATIVQPVERPGLMDDPLDDEVLAVAAVADADFVVSGDQHLLRVETYEGIDVLTPRQFIERLDEPS